MQLQAIALGTVTFMLLAGCFQAPAPPPAATSPPGAAAAARAGPLKAVGRLAEEPDVETVPVLASMVREDADPAVRREAIYAIGDVGSEADAPTIAQALRDPDDGVRMAAIDVLSTMDGQTPTALLVDALNDPSPKVRLRAVDAFGDIDGPTASLALQQALSDPDAMIRETAAALLEERNAGRP